MTLVGRRVASRCAPVLHNGLLASRGHRGIQRTPRATAFPFRSLSTASWAMLLQFQGYQNLYGHVDLQCVIHVQIVPRVD